MRCRTGDEQAAVCADTVIVASEVTPGGALVDELARRGVEVHAAGDAAEVGYIEGAVHSAWAVAAAL